MLTRCVLDQWLWTQEASRGLGEEVEVEGEGEGWALQTALPNSTAANIITGANYCQRGPQLTEV